MLHMLVVTLSRFCLFSPFLLRKFKIILAQFKLNCFKISDDKANLFCGSPILYFIKYWTVWVISKSFINLISYKFWNNINDLFLYFRADVSGIFWTMAKMIFKASCEKAIMLIIFRNFPEFTESSLILLHTNYIFNSRCKPGLVIGLVGFGSGRFRVKKIGFWTFLGWNGSNKNFRYFLIFQNYQFTTTFIC